MSAETSFASDNATAELKDFNADTQVLRPGRTPKHFGVSQQPAWLRAFGLVDGDVIRVLMVGGDGSLTAPFRPKQADPAEDVALTPGRTSVPIYFPGRYVLERLSGGVLARVFAFNATVSHEAGSFYNEVTGDTVVNSIAVQNDSPGVSMAVDQAFGDVTISSAVNLSADAGNIIVQEPDGFFAQAVQSVAFNDTTSINGTASRVGNAVSLSAAAIISPDAGNALVAQANGLFVEPTDLGYQEIALTVTLGALPALATTPITFTTILVDSTGTVVVPDSSITIPWTNVAGQSYGEMQLNALFQGTIQDVQIQASGLDHTAPGNEQVSINVFPVSGTITINVTTGDDPPTSGVMALRLRQVRPVVP